MREFRRMKECASLKEKKLKKVQHDVAARVNYIRRLRQEEEKRKVLQLVNFWFSYVFRGYKTRCRVSLIVRCHWKGLLAASPFLQDALSSLP